MQTKSQIEYGVCPYCTTLRALRKDGSLRAHDRRDAHSSSQGTFLSVERCPGSHLTPADAQQQIRDTNTRRQSEAQARAARRAAGQ